MPAKSASPQRKPPDTALELADRLHSAAIHLLRRLRRQDDASGLPAPQLSALSVIVFGGPITLGDLAAFFRYPISGDPATEVPAAGT